MGVDSSKLAPSKDENGDVPHSVEAEQLDDATLLAASRVLETSELLEAVLLELPIRSLVAAQMVCWGWQDLVTSSPALQAKTRFERHAIANVDCLNLLVRDMATHAHSLASPRWIQPAASWRKMQLCYPVLQRAHAVAYYNGGGFSTETSVACENAQGVTLGDLHEALERRGWQESRQFKLIQLHIIDRDEPRRNWWLLGLGESAWDHLPNAPGISRYHNNAAYGTPDLG